MWIHNITQKSHSAQACKYYLIFFFNVHFFHYFNCKLVIIFLQFGMNHSGVCSLAQTFAKQEVRRLLGFFSWLLYIIGWRWYHSRYTVHSHWLMVRHIWNTPFYDTDRFVENRHTIREFFIIIRRFKSRHKESKVKQRAKNNSTGKSQGGYERVALLHSVLNYSSTFKLCYLLYLEQWKEIHLHDVLWAKVKLANSHGR